MWFKVEINKLTALLLPSSLRKKKILAWLRALCYPLEKIRYDFEQTRAQNIYNLQYNSQVCYLRKVLNDRFDPEFRRIIIEDGIQYKRLYIYPRRYIKSVYLGRVFLHKRGHYIGGGVDFVVILPLGLRYDIYQLQATIDFYKLAGKHYEIITH